MLNKYIYSLSLFYGQFVHVIIRFNTFFNVYKMSNFANDPRKTIDNNAPKSLLPKRCFAIKLIMP